MILHPDLYQLHLQLACGRESWTVSAVGRALTLGYDWTDWQDANGLVNEEVVIP